jgi:hypothetical protein
MSETNPQLDSRKVTKTTTVSNTKVKDENEEGPPSKKQERKPRDPNGPRRAE